MVFVIFMDGIKICDVDLTSGQPGKSFGKITIKMATGSDELDL